MAQILAPARRCASCYVSPIRNVVIKCLDCPGVALCSRCYEEGSHPDHNLVGVWFSPVQVRGLPAAQRHGRRGGAPDTTHTNIFCDGCDTTPIHGTRYKCTVCPDYDLCERCHTRGQHAHHDMMAMRNASTAQGSAIRRRQEPPRSHTNIQCDGCGWEPISGIRYKCTKCPDYDLCSSCRSAGLHGQHKMVSVLKPLPFTLLQQLKQSGLASNPGFYCDGCGVFPILGGSYSCAQCDDFDLCQACREAKSVHAHHRMNFTRAPNDQPNPQPREGQDMASHENNYCDNCRVTPIRGLRHKCKTCPDFDLCDVCKSFGVHARHAMTLIRPRAIQTNRIAQQPQHVAGPSSMDGITVSTDDNELASRMTCPVCMDREKNLAFQCGHSTCAECSDQLNRCPLCQVTISQRIRLYI